MPVQKKPESMAFSENEKKLFDAMKLVKAHRRKMIAAIVEQDEERQGETITNAAERWGFDEKRFTYVLARSLRMARILQNEVTVDAAYRRIPIHQKIKFCQSVAILQEFTNKTLENEIGCRYIHRQNLDLAILSAAHENYKMMCAETGRDHYKYYSIDVITKALAIPERIVQLKYETFFERGIWLAQARVLAGLAETIRDTQIEGATEWVDEDFDSQLDEYLKVQEQEDLKEAALTKRLTEISQRKRHPPRLRLD